MPLHFTPTLSSPLHATSRHFTLLHFTSHFVRLTPRHFTLLHFTSHSVHLTSCHFMPLHFTSHSFHLTSCHFTPLHLPSFCLTSPHLTSSHPSSHPPASLRFADNASLATLNQKSTASSVNAQSSKHACQPASPEYWPGTDLNFFFRFRSGGRAEGGVKEEEEQKQQIPEISAG